MTSTSQDAAPQDAAFVVEDGGTLTVGIVLPDGDTPPTVQRFAAGELVDWSVGDPQGCDLVVTAPGVGAAGFCRAAGGSPEGKGDTGSAELMERTRVSVRTAEGRTAEMAMPPFDIVERGDLDGLLAVPNLDVRAEFRYRATPYGDIANAATIVGGKVTSWVAGPQTDPEVTVDLVWTSNLEYRAGRIRPEDMLSGPGIAGSRKHLVAMLGLLISEEWRHAVRLDADLADVLVRWGALWGSEAARAFFTQRATGAGAQPA